jgi:hypothetical protein
MPAFLDIHTLASTSTTKGNGGRDQVMSFLQEEDRCLQNAACGAGQF